MDNEPLQGMSDGTLVFVLMTIVSLILIAFFGLLWLIAYLCVRCCILHNRLNKWKLPLKDTNEYMWLENKV
jgi:hypothetical protein